MHKQSDDERRYAEYLARNHGQLAPDDPLVQVSGLRKQQLQACDLEKRKEILQMQLQAGMESPEDE